MPGIGMNRLLFLHFDDEISKVSWIPRSLRTSCLVKFDGDIGASGKMVSNHDKTQFQFMVLSKVNNLQFYVTYRFFDKLNDLLEVDVEELRHAVIILDVMGEGGPDHVGVRAFQSLLSRGVDSQKIYFLTAYMDALTKLRGQGLGDDHFLAKPVDPEQLFCAILGGSRICGVSLVSC